MSDDDSKDDPEDDPYRSKYKAREILMEMKDKLKRLYEANSECEFLRFAMTALDLKIGINFMDTEELSTGEEHFIRGLDTLEKFRLHPEASNIYHTIQNNLGILWTGRRNYPKALEFLQKAEGVYLDYKQEVGGSPKSFEECFTSSDEDFEKLEHKRTVNFESTYTHTLYYMAQVFAKIGEGKKSAQYCQLTLQRQLDGQKYDAFDWAINAATLSQYYMTINDYKQARHCLGCAELIFKEAEQKDAENEDEEVREKIQQGRADIQRCWSKYGIALMESSKEQLMKAVEDKGAKEDPQKVDEDQEEKENRYQRFNLEATFHENQISCNYLRDFEEAREAFLKVQKWLNAAKEFYIIDGKCSDHIEIVQDYSHTFKALAFFEMDFERQCKMHKRRIDMLSEVVKDLNPQHYLLVIRQLLFEMAETYSQMLDLKLAITEEESGPPSAHAVKKINTLTRQSIEKYQAYLDTVKDLKTKELPEEFSDTDVRPSLLAMFCMGRLYSKILVADVRQRLEFIKKTKSYYEYVVNYCDKYPAGAEAMADELGVCREMVGLLPVKMEKIRQEANL